MKAFDSLVDFVVDTVKGNCPECHKKDYTFEVLTLDRVNIVHEDSPYVLPLSSAYHKTCSCGYEWYDCSE